MSKLITPRAIAITAKKAILAIMATIVMANVNFSLAVWGIQLKSIKKFLSDVRFTSIWHFVKTLSMFLLFCHFHSFLLCKNYVSLRPTSQIVLIKVAQEWSKNHKLSGDFDFKKSLISQHSSVGILFSQQWQCQWWPIMNSWSNGDLKTLVLWGPTKEIWSSLSQLEATWQQDWGSSTRAVQWQLVV